MKKLNKLIINPEKVIKNEELVNLRGSYGGGSGGEPCTCTCFKFDASKDETTCYGYVFAPDGNCPSYCSDFYLDGNITGECGYVSSCF